MINKIVTYIIHFLSITLLSDFFSCNYVHRYTILQFNLLQALHMFCMQKCIFVVKKTMSIRNVKLYYGMNGIDTSKVQIHQIFT